MQDKYIFTPGPVKIADDILALGALQTPYFRNEAFSEVLLECEESLLKVTNAPQGSRAIFLTASGTAAMEAAVVNLIAKEDRTVVVNGGGFGQRFFDICQLHELDAVDFKVHNDDLSDTTVLNSYRDARTLLVNGHETSVGTLYDLNAIGSFCHKNSILNIVDGISMFVTDELDMQKFHIDALIISSHKGLALPPGLSMVILTPKAMERLQPSSAFYFNFHRYLEDGKRGQTPFTPAVTILLQLQLRLRQIVENTIEIEIKKAKMNAHYFRKSIEKLPLKAYSDYMPNAMSTLHPTDGKKAFEIVNDLEKEYNVVVAPNGGTLKDVIFRVSHMGDMTKAYMDVLIDALYDYYEEKR